MSTKRILLLTLLTLPGLTVGCGPGASEGPSLHSVVGTVQYDGTPIEEGRITFRTNSGAGKSYSAEIMDGKYSLEAEAGKANVEIMASRIVPGKFGEAASPDEPAPPLSEMYIPSKYNSETTLEAEVTTGENTIPFSLEAE